MEKVCEYCGVELIKRPREPKNIFDTRRYCSRSCLAWARHAHPSWTADNPEEVNRDINEVLGWIKKKKRIRNQHLLDYCRYRMILAANKWNGEGDLKGWLFIKGVYAYKDWVKLEKRESCKSGGPLISLDWIIEQQEDFDKALPRELLPANRCNSTYPGPKTQIMRMLLEKLPERQRKLLKERYFDGETQAALGKEARVCEATISLREQAALKALRKLVEKHNSKLKPFWRDLCLR